MCVCVYQGWGVGGGGVQTSGLKRPASLLVVELCNKALL